MWAIQGRCDFILPRHVRSGQLKDFWVGFFPPTLKKDARKRYPSSILDIACMWCLGWALWQSSCNQSQVLVWEKASKVYLAGKMKTHALDHIVQLLSNQPGNCPSLGLCQITLTNKQVLPAWSSLELMDCWPLPSSQLFPCHYVVNHCLSHLRLFFLHLFQESAPLSPNCGCVSFLSPFSQFHTFLRVDFPCLWHMPMVSQAVLLFSLPFTHRGSPATP